MTASLPSVATPGRVGPPEDGSVRKKERRVRGRLLIAEWREEGTDCRVAESPGGVG